MNKNEIRIYICYGKSSILGDAKNKVDHYEDAKKLFTFLIKRIPGGTFDHLFNMMKFWKDDEGALDSDMSLDNFFDYYYVEDENE